MPHFEQLNDKNLFRHMFDEIYDVTQEGHVLFNNAINTFLFMDIWFQTYGKRSLR